VDAAEYLRNEKDVLFVFIGEGGQQSFLEESSRTRNLHNILFLPYQRPEDLPYSLTSGDIALIAMKPGTQGLCVPGKVYSAMAAGSAILGLVPKDSEIADLIDLYQCGIRVEPEQPVPLAHAILTLHRNRDLLKTCQKNARRSFEMHFTKDRAMDEYESLFHSLHANASPVLAATLVPLADKDR
jgi:glycosyltransferase involved in cell wall biosynthesis